LEAIYYRDYDVCAGGGIPCTSYSITWTNCCRNGAITSGADNQGIGTSLTTINLSITPCNSSPTFLSPPVPYICAGQPFTFNQGAFDPDGDSLSYVLGPCRTSTGAAQVTYFPGYSPAQPLGPDWDVQLNPFTGDITITPNPGGGLVVGVMCIVVQEWRNGTLIGSVVRDMQITVISGCTSTNPVTGGVQNLRIGGVPAFPLSATEVLTCANTPVCFDIPVISQDTSLDYSISWNQAIPAATFTDANGGPQVNLITGKAPVGRFCWTPPQQGTYTFVVTAKDDACPVPGLNQFTVLIYVSNVLSQSTSTAVPINNCNSVVLTALPRNQIQSPYNNIFTYVWSGNGNLQLPYNTHLTDSQLSHFYPAPNTYFYDLSLRDTFGCRHAFRSFVTLNQGVIADAGPDLTICSGFQFQLGAPYIPGQFYDWTPGIGLSDSTIANPFFSLANINPSGTPDTVDYDLYVTDSICETWDYVRVVINPSLQVRVSPAAPIICRGDSVTLTASGGATYLWSSGATTPSIKVGPTSATTFSVVTFSNGCTSQPEYVTVNIDPGPTGQIAGNFRVCPGDNALLIGAGSTNFQWNNGSGSNLQTISNVVGDTSVWMIPITNGCPGDTVFATVGNYDAPVANFGTQAVCEGVTSVFIDSSTIASGSIVGWTWNFGDPGSGSNNISRQSSPTHVFSAAGPYTVTLTVVSDNGCENTLTRAIAVEAVPVVNYTFTNVCEGFPNAFTDATTIGAGGAIASYVWNFGDGNSGQGSVTSHQYTNSGFYNAQLVVTSTGGCIDSFTQTVFVHPNPVADFQVINACQDSVVLAFQGSNVGGGLDRITTYVWNFDDPASGGNNTSSDAEPVHVYTTQGIKNITLTVVTGNGCVDAVTRPVTVYEEPVAAFTVEGNCANHDMLFTETSTTNPATPIVAWSWDLGNGYTTDRQVFSHRYGNANPGTYDVTLKVTSSENCTNTIVKQVVVNPVPGVSFLANPVCVGDTTRFINRSNIAYTNMVDWQWDFGGPGRGPNGLPEPYFVYDLPGEYMPWLTITSDSGCSAKAFTRLTVWEPAPLAEILNDTVCFSDRAFLLAGAAVNVTVNWYEKLNDPQPFYTGYSYVTPPLPFSTTYYVETTSEHGCISDKFPITGMVAQDELLAINPSVRVLELPLGIVEFEPVSTIQLVEWSWDFGDGNTSDVEGPVHEFSYPDIFVVTLTAVDRNGCIHTATTEIEVKKVARAYIPNAFTPNNDGRNDEFRIGTTNLREFTIRIFNRWGQEVFASSQPDFEWNGTSKTGKALPEGVYVYTMRYLDIDGKVVEDNGTVTLIR
jgi:gliding motility-associated-like protein